MVDLLQRLLRRGFESLSHGSSVSLVTIGLDELGLAARNHGMPLEMLREPITPLGLHYLLIHFDIPAIDTYRLAIGDRTFTLDELRARERLTIPVTLECAGNGRALLEGERAASQPWLSEAIGTAEWTGTPLAPLLRETGLADGAAEIVFTGADRGIQGGVEHAYARSLPLAEALRDDVLLAYEMNGAPLLPQHGAPLRLVVPGWYGMTHVKWLTSIAASDRAFDGWQQTDAYLIDGVPVQRIEPRALMVPPGIPDFLSRDRFAEPGRHEIVGRAWSGYAPIERVEVSVDGGDWEPAQLDEPLGDYAWRGWRWTWTAEPGEHALRCRATDGSGRAQPDSAAWNHGGYSNNSVQVVRVTV
jgi:DMSO/TMAO reductase YedYZ molybdopterin-dependent catalytic subunit